MSHIYTILLLAVAVYAANATGSFRDGGIKRFSRAAQVLRKIQVFEHIFREAKFMFRSFAGEEVYLRKGGYTQARIDFYAAEPKRIKDISVHGKEGFVGDKMILLYKPDGFITNPTLFIESKRFNFPVVRVIYED